MPKRNLIYLVVVAAVAAFAVLVVGYVEKSLRAQAAEADLRATRSTLRHLESEVLAWRLLKPNVPDLKSLAKLIEQSKQEYQLKPEQWRKVTEGGIRGRVEAMRELTGDSYLRYIPRDQKNVFEQRIKGIDNGTGLKVEIKGGVARVVGVLGGSPAHRAGLVPGDRIIAINGTDIADIEHRDAGRLLKGQGGGKVELMAVRARGVLTEGAAEIITLSPEEFPVLTVEGLLRDEKGDWVYDVDADRGLHYLRITEFVQTTEEQFQAVMRKLPSPKGIVLDVRDNPGGLPEAAAEVANLFLSTGRIFTIVNIKGDKPHESSFAAHKGGTYPQEIRVVVLIDESTSSAAEIVAGAMRLHRRAALVGGRSHGKTRVQNVIQIPDLGLMVMSTGRFFLGRPGQPDSAVCGLKHVDADAPVKIDDQAAVELAHLRARARALPGKPPFKPLDGVAQRSLAEELNRLDAQLARAVALLKEPGKLDRILESECPWAKGEDE